MSGTNVANIKETLERAMQKAIAGGWKNRSGYYVRDNGSLGTPGTHEIHGTDYGVDLSPKELIFRHDFAKALWGLAEPKTFEQYIEDHQFLMHNWTQAERERHFKADYEAYLAEFDPDTKWKGQLQQMVIADDPIEYLGENT